MTKNEADHITPQGDIPSEAQSFVLPPDFDPAAYPHLSVQSSIFSLLMSALKLSARFEIQPGGAERRRILEEVTLEYQKTCEALARNTDTAGQSLTNGGGSR